MCQIFTKFCDILCVLWEAQFDCKSLNFCLCGSRIHAQTFNGDNDFEDVLFEYSDNNNNGIYDSGDDVIADYNGDGDRLVTCLSMIRNDNSGCWLDLVIDFDPGDSLCDIVGNVSFG